MPDIYRFLIQALCKDYSIMRDIYILMEEITWATGLALENEDIEQVNFLTGQRDEYNKLIKEREQQLHKTEDMLKDTLGWECFSMGRLLSEVKDDFINDLGKIKTEIHNIICSLARMDMSNYHLHQGKLLQGKERRRLEILRHKAEIAYLDYPQPPKLKVTGSNNKYA